MVNDPGLINASISKNVQYYTFINVKFAKIIEIEAKPYFDVRILVIHMKITILISKTQSLQLYVAIE